MSRTLSSSGSFFLRFPKDKARRMATWASFSKYLPALVCYSHCPAALSSSMVSRGQDDGVVTGRASLGGGSSLEEQLFDLAVE